MGAIFTTDKSASPFPALWERLEFNLLIASGINPEGRVSSKMPVFPTHAEWKTPQSSSRSISGEGVPDRSIPPPARAVALKTGLDRRRKNVNLLCHESRQLCWRPLTGSQRTTRIAQIAQHEGATDAVMLAPTPMNDREITCGQRIVADEFTPLRRRIEQRGDLGLGQLLSAHRYVSQFGNTLYTGTGWPRQIQLPSSKPPGF